MLHLCSTIIDNSLRVRRLPHDFYVKSRVFGAALQQSARL
jgi:hypothetical protein